MRSACRPPISASVPCFSSAPAPWPVGNVVRSLRATKIGLHTNCFYNSVFSLTCSHEGVYAISAIPTSLGQTTQ